MSIVPKETIHVIAQSIGINSLHDDVAAAVAPDVEYRMREIMQEAIKCMRHSKRSVLTTDDVNTALSLRNVEPLYGFASGDPLRFRRAVGHSDLFFIDDRELDFKEISDVSLPKAPLDTAVMAHWLAIEGIQPAIPENVPIDSLTVPPETKKIESIQGVVKSSDHLTVDVKLPVKHVLSRELQLYFEKVTELIVTGADELLLKDALASLATDSGLHPLVPYFTQFIADEVTRSLDDLPLLFSLMRVVQSLLLNPHIHIEPYLHQLMPSVITCLVAKRLGGKSLVNHWELRDFTASLIAFICKRFGHAYHNLQPRVTRTLLHAFLDPKRAMTQHYGAVKGIAALGSKVVRLLILPNLEVYLNLLQPEMSFESQPNEIKRYEAIRVYGALQSAAGNCIYEILQSISKEPSVRKRPLNNSKSSQLSHKKPSTDNSAPGGDSGDAMQGVEGHGNETLQQNGKDEGSRRESRRRNVLSDAWKEDAEVGELVKSLVDLFGEGILPFIPLREMSKCIL